jgi:tetratricopeptide (TPR) repeat protein
MLRVPYNKNKYLIEVKISKEDVMKKMMLLVCGMIFAATVFGGDFPQDYQSAIKLYNGGKYAESEEAFVKLTEQTSAPRGIDESLAYAAYSAEQQKKSDKALEFAGKIKDKTLNTFCRMKLLEIQKKWVDIIALSKDEDFEKWPEYLIYGAYNCRGNAYSRANNAEKSEKDFLCAEKNTMDAGNKASVFQTLGNLYRDVLKDKQKSLDAYGKVVKIMSAPKPSMSGGMLGRALTARAKLLASQGKGTEALAELEKFKEIETKDPYWSCAMQICYGEVYDLTGKNTEALESYRKAAAVANAPADMLKDANQKMADLEQKIKK